MPPDSPHPYLEAPVAPLLLDESSPVKVHFDGGQYLGDGKLIQMWDSGLNNAATRNPGKSKWREDRPGDLGV
jgi:hypothetical protein